MIKKITTSVATLALSVGIISTASATELAQPSSPIQEPNQVNSIITPYNNSIYAEKIVDYYKLDYPVAGSTPYSIFVTKEVNGNKYGGTLTRKSIVESGKWGDWWRVTYSGQLTRFIE
ncbi:hypothetical protein MKX47_21315 [Solibacillus sp. FSL R7-0668]|uniref:hypothetical protein n=1 Tax=Solibacillus sp. FSL R7-0668 TaxID=2921688 RepID=UPI0030F7DF14